MSGGDSNQKKRTATIAVSSLILVALGVAATVGFTNTNNHKDGGSGGGSQVSSSTKAAVQTICQPTDYKEACVESLKDAGNSSDPHELIKAGFTYTKKKLADIMEHSSTLKEAEKDPMASQALAICKGQMNLAIDHLEQSFNKIGILDITTLDDILEDLETWLSSVLTYQGTCLDNFENITSSAVDQIKDSLNGTIKFSSNALVMVKELNKIFKDLNIGGAGSRRLLQDHVLGHGELPTWIDHARRRLLADDAKADLVIAQDGSGNAKTFAEAIKALPVESTKPFVVHVKAGVYNEIVNIPANVWNITWIGDGADKTKITSGKSYADGLLVLNTATFTLLGAGHTFKNIGFENSAGAIKKQAVAIAVDGDRSAFFNCRFDGFQSTLYAHSNRQFYRECTITGTIDFVFGDAKALFQNCMVIIKKPLEDQKCVVTASGVFDSNMVTGAMVFQNSTITADPSYLPVKDITKSYLGRPFKEFSKTIYMQCFIDSVIDPEGWVASMGTFGTDTCFFAEYNNRGPGANTAQRVKWSGIKTLNADEVNAFTGSVFLANDDWVTSTGIPYSRTMMTV